MSITFSCPNQTCESHVQRKKLTAKDEQAGRNFPCPACKMDVTIPTKEVAECQKLYLDIFRIQNFNMLMVYAIATKHDDVMDWLLKHRPADQDINAEIYNLGRILTILSLTVVDNDFISRGDNSGNTFMHEAARRGHVKAMQCLKNHGARVDVMDNNGDMPIHHAALLGHFEVIEWLVNENGVDINVRGQRGRTALQYSAFLGETDCLERLYKELRADLTLRDSEGLSAMEHASHGGQNGSIKCLARLDYDLVETSDDTGLTPMFYAVMAGKIESIRCLYDLGAKIDVKDAKGLTPMRQAAKMGQIASIECLNGLGAKAKDDEFAMISAVSEGQIASMECLHRLGANVDFQEGELGLAPIHFAAATGEIAGMECLQRLGANLHAKSNKGKTALDLAIQFGKTEAAEWLRRNGG